MEPVLVVLIIFGSIGLIIWRWIDARHRERIAMIEKGVTPADFKGVQVREMLRANPLSSLKWGLLASFVGVGLIVANWLDHTYYFSDSIYLAGMLLFGGAALILFYFIASRKENQG
jgi:hypothetical protein